MTETRPITLADVAAEADVHPATVSRALSRPELVHEATLRRVRAAVDRLGYTPNQSARRLAGGRTSTLAMLVPDIANPFFSVVVQAAQRRAALAGQLVVLADTGQSTATELEAVRSLAPNVDGIIVCTPLARVGSLRAAAVGRPLVFVNRRARGVSSVSVDQRLVASLAVEHLLALGHECIAVVQGPASYWSSQQRADALGRALTDGVVALGPVDPTFDGGRKVLAEVLDVGATAVAAFNDAMALGVLAEAAAYGVDVPTDLSIVGSDGIAMGGMVTPALTTIAAPLDDLATTAVEQVLDLLAGGDPNACTLPPHLVERATTAPPR